MHQMLWTARYTRAADVMDGYVYTCSRCYGRLGIHVQQMLWTASYTRASYVMDG